MTTPPTNNPKKPLPPMRYWREYTTVKERIMDEYPMSAWPPEMRMEREADLASSAMYKTTLVPAQAKDCFSVPHIEELHKRYVEYVVAAKVAADVLSQGPWHTSMPEYKQLVKIVVQDRDNKRDKYEKYGGRLADRWMNEWNGDN